MLMLKRIVVLLQKGQGTGPTWNILCIFRKYNLLEMLVDCIENGTYTPYCLFKKQVKFIVTNHDIKKWKVNCSLYKSLSMMYIDKSSHSTLGWITFLNNNPNKAKHCRCIINLLLNVYRLGNALCPLCHNHSLESIQHILFDCPHSENVRNNLWSVVLEACPRALALELKNMTIPSKTSFVLNAFNCNIVREWNQLYTNLCVFIYTLYTNHYRITRIN